jgi:TPR repeat protein
MAMGINMKLPLQILPAILVLSLAGIAVPSQTRADYLAAEAALQANDFARAVPLLSEEAELGNPVAAYNLGKIYATGALGAPDYVSAATWFRQAAEVGSTPARFDGRQLGAQAADLIFAAQLYSQFELAKLYEEGKGVPPDIGEAVRWYSRAADQELDLAQLQLVRLYREGRGAELPADPAIAAKWLTRLAEHGNIAAMNDLGRSYLQGQGVPKNAKLAHDWFDKASTLGSATAAFNLGLLYQAGYLGEPDYLRAAESYNLGANRKDAQSMAALGDLYFAGNGVPQSNLQAYVWYDLATRYGLLIAGERRDKIAQSMNQAEISTAKAMADQWRPQGDFGFALPAGLEPEPAASEPAVPEALPAEPVVASPSVPDLTAPPAPQPEPTGVEPLAPDPMAPQPAVPEVAPEIAPAALPAPVQSQPSSDETFIQPIAPANSNTLIEPAPAPLVDPLAPATPETPLSGAPQPGSKPFDPTTSN